MHGLYYSENERLMVYAHQYFNKVAIGHVLLCLRTLQFKAIPNYAVEHNQQLEQQVYFVI